MYKGDFIYLFFTVIDLNHGTPQTTTEVMTRHFLFFLWPRVQPHLSIFQPLDGNTAIAAILQHIFTPPPVWRLASIWGNFLARPDALTPEELLLCSWWKQTLCQGREVQAALPYPPQPTGPPPAQEPRAPYQLQPHHQPVPSPGPNGTWTHMLLLPPALLAAFRGWRVRERLCLHSLGLSCTRACPGCSSVTPG